MIDWKAYLLRVVNGLEERLDEARRIWTASSAQETVVFPYLGYGTGERLRVMGRVLRDPGIAPAYPDDPPWKNLRNALRRFESDEVAGARLAIEAGGAAAEVRCDEEGFFDHWLDLPHPLERQGLTLVGARLSLLDHVGAGSRPQAFEGQVLVPPGDAAYGVVSDLDDTVLVTGATNLLRVARTTLFENEHHRLVFPGVAALYRTLQGGTNPIFYVSSSPWNLYDLLAAALERHDIPLGPMLLRDWGIGPDEFFPVHHLAYKLKAIGEVIAAFPTLPFVLIGDSGQQDPEVYLEVASRFPGRIPVIYIRDVRWGGRDEALSEQARRARGLGSEFVVVSSSFDIARHAAATGLISAADLASVEPGGNGLDG